MTRIVVILAHAGDAGAGLVAGWLARKFGSQAVRIVRPEMLSLAQWSHRVDARGHATSRVAWPRAQPLEDSDVGAVLNRIQYLPMPRFHRASAKDRDYAAAELQAVVASWLAGLGDRVVHVVRRRPWVTPVIPLQHWASAAASCRLPVRDCAIASSARALRWRVCPDPSGHVAAGTVLVAGRETGGLLDRHYGPHCLAAARVLGFPLLEFQFVTEDTRTVLSGVDPLPSLAEPWAAALTGRLLESLAAGRPG
jgi:hypothetical protein